MTQSLASEQAAGVVGEVSDWAIEVAALVVLTQSDLQQARRRMTIATYGGGRGRRAAVPRRPSGRTDRFRAGNRLSWFSSNSEVNLTRFSGSGPTLVV